jgi:peptidoglycan hydrolase-like protein with peptidoglycan-binding domain
VADPILSLGSTGTWVSTLQADLQKAGFDPKGVDGIFGKNTKQALQDFQKANGLESKKGIAGSETWGFIHQDSFTPASAATRSAATRSVQASAVRPSSISPTSGKYWAQADPRYSRYNIGNPNSHLGNAGCGPTAIANALGLTPTQVVDKINAAGGFSRSELSSFDNAKGVAAVGGRLVTNFSAADLAKQVDSGKPVVLGVSHDGGQGHYVTLLANGRNGNTFQAVDPAGGRQFTMTANRDGSLTGSAWRDYVSRQKAVFFN